MVQYAKMASPIDRADLTTSVDAYSAPLFYSEFCESREISFSMTTTGDKPVSFFWMAVSSNCPPSLAHFELPPQRSVVYPGSFIAFSGLCPSAVAWGKTEKEARDNLEREIQILSSPKLSVAELADLEESEKELKKGRGKRFRNAKELLRSLG